MCNVSKFSFLWWGYYYFKGFWFREVVYSLFGEFWLVFGVYFRVCFEKDFDFFLYFLLDFVLVLGDRGVIDLV